MFRFEKLEVWHQAVSFADRIYKITSEFPSDERFGSILHTELCVAHGRGP